MSAVLIGLIHLMPAWDLGAMPYRLVRLMAALPADLRALWPVLPPVRRSGLWCRSSARRLAVW